MRKAGIIALVIFAVASFSSCSSSKPASNGYFGVSNEKANKKQQKEFKKSKHKIRKGRRTKVRN